MPLNEITKGMSNAAEQINQNFKQLNEPIYEEHAINSNGFTGILRITRLGKIVHLSGEYLGTGVGEVKGKYLYYLPEGLRPVSRIPVFTTVHPTYSSYFNQQYSYLTVYDSNGGLAIEHQNNAGLKFIFSTTYIAM